MTYKEKLLDPRWQKKRLRILERDNWECKLCGDKTSTLHVHHKAYNGEPWDAKETNLTTLCYNCHTMIELVNGGSADNVKMLVYNGGGVPVRILLDKEKLVISMYGDYLSIGAKLDGFLGEIKNYYFGGEEQNG